MGRRSDVNKDELYRFIQSQCGPNSHYRASIRAIIAALGHGSVPTITKYLSELERDGLIRIRNGKPTTYQLIDNTQALTVGSESDIVGMLDNCSASLSQVAATLKDLYRELDELRAFKRSIQEISRTRYEILYRREIVDEHIDLKPVAGSIVYEA